MIGQTLGHYKILDKLGAGGMGEVYLAEDTTLKRQVALKVLPPDLAASQERLERFQREAETLAALDHPNIVTVFTVEQEGDIPFLTMQLVEGKPLSQLIPKGGMQLERILKIAVPLADALATAHEKGVIHRDLKPANIMVTDEGRVKVLDFGLAKLRQETQAAVATELPTEPLTEEGRLLGTAPYMSPEQIEGRALDSRSDIFSLGIVMYEMASGRRPFEGESSTSVMARILETEPEQLGERRPDLPPDFVRIVRRCLRKKPEDRYNDTRDLQVALKDLREESSSQFSGQIRQGLQPRRLSRYKRGAMLGAIALVALLATGIGMILSRPAKEGAGGGPGTVQHQRITFSGDATHPEISPDGHFIAYVTGTGVVVRDIQGEGSVEVLESDSIEFLAVRWSPDDLRLLVHGVFDGEWKAFVVPRLGGPAQSLKGMAYMCWSPDGKQVAGTWASKRPIHLINVESSETVETINLEGEFLWKLGVDWSFPTGLLLITTLDAEDRYAVWTLSTTGRQQTKVFETEQPIRAARWSLSKSEVFFLQDSGTDAELWKIEVNVDTGEAESSARSVLTGLPTKGGFSVSRDGDKLAYSRTADFSTIWRSDLEVSGDGLHVRNTQLDSGTLFSRGFSISPDGEWVAISKGDEKESDIYLLSLLDGEMSKLTHLDGRNAFPVWSPDGQTIAFGSTHDGTPRVRRVSPNGGTPQVVETGDFGTNFGLEWAPGERLLYQHPGNKSWSSLDVRSGGERLLLSADLSESGWFFQPLYSPDGSRLVLGANLGGSTSTVKVGEPSQPAKVLSSDTGALRGAISQALSASGYQGKKMRLRARVRVSGENAQASLFLKVQLQNGETGFFEIMRDRPIGTSDWSDYEIEGIVDEAAAEIIFGGRLYGAGAAWFDDFDLKVGVEGGGSESLHLENPGFQEPSDAESPLGWRILAPTEASFTITGDGQAPSEKALRIEALGLPPAKGAFWPAGWSEDGKYVLVVPVQESVHGSLYDPLVYRINADGSPAEMFLDLELSEKLWWLDQSVDGKFMVVETVRHQSDVWIAENFDLGLN